MFEIWVIPLLQAPSTLYLSADEQTRAARFRFESDRRRYQRSHSALRLILSAKLNRDPMALSFATYPHGKPYLPDSNLHFNLSHTADLALCALADHPVGVDVEQVHAIPDWHEIATMVFSQQEQQVLETTPDAQRDLIFLNLWTRKEAVLKATGEGFTNYQYLSAFNVPSQPSSTPTHLTTVTIAAQPYSLFTFQPADGYLAAAAIKSNYAILPTIRQFQV